MRLVRRVFVVLLAIVSLGRADNDVTGSTPSSTSSLLLKRLGESTMREDTEPATTQAPPKPSKPEMYSLRVTSRIEYRFANTLITSRLANPANKSQEIFFSVVLPETAFISKFLMEVGGKVYEAYVKEKEEAKQEYEQAVASGLGAAHIALSARDSNRFTVSVNIEPLSKVTFNLTYEELLTRRLGAYNHVINLDPGQIVREMKVEVFIKESRNITTLRVPELRSGNEVDANELTKANPLATVLRTSATEAHITFSPTPEEQKALGKAKAVDPDDVDEGHKVTEGLGGQFVVQYDVNRDPQAGEVLVNNGFFVHFFAPADLPPLRKHALFVLDVSGSMEGRKIEQLKEAMDAILDDLNEGDYFNIIEFSYSVTVWNLDNTAASAVFSPYNYDVTAPQLGPTPAFPATPEYVAKAKEIVKKMRAGGGTNIYDTLKTVIRVAHNGLENITATDTNTSTDNTNITSTNSTDSTSSTSTESTDSTSTESTKSTSTESTKSTSTESTVSTVSTVSTKSTNTVETGETRKPIIVFLTDGEPTVGETRLSKIFSVVAELNRAPEAAIFSLAFGDDADLNFLKRLSLKNSGFARKIYEASDAALQLRDFYRQIASPLLENVTFNYVPDKIVPEATTKVTFHTLFSGSELVVAGKLRALPNTTSSFDALHGDVSGVSATGESSIRIPPMIDLVLEPPTPASQDVSSLERLWAYLTIKQLLEKSEEKRDEEFDEDQQVEASNETVSPKKEALALALQYSFVTPLTSLVVVKPNETKTSDSETVNPVDGDTSDKFGGFSGSFGPVDRISASGVSLPLSGSPPYPQSASYPAMSRPGVAFAPSSLQARPIYSPPRTSTFRPHYRPAVQDNYGGAPASESFSADKFSFGAPGSFSGGQFGGVPAGPPGVPILESSQTYELEEAEEDADVYETTTQTTLQLIDLTSLLWLDLVRVESDVNLPFGANGSTVTYQLQSRDQPNATYTPEACTTLSGASGKCLHLQNCTLNVFQYHIDVYRTYFCLIDNFAGACCPEELTANNYQSSTADVSAAHSSTPTDVITPSDVTVVVTPSSFVHDVTTPVSKVTVIVTPSSSGSDVTTSHNDVTSPNSDVTALFSKVKDAVTQLSVVTELKKQSTNQSEETTKVSETETV